MRLLHRGVAGSAIRTVRQAMSLLKTHQIDFRILDRPDVPVRKVAAGETIILEGGVAHEMFLLRKGRAEIRVKDQPIEEVGPGGIFGEMALIDQSPRSATVVALEDTEIIPINERLFVILVQDAPYFALDVMRTLVERIRAMNRRI
jgi:CRP/FNR family cyclic AMP-dependent transcriptional regulator